MICSLRNLALLLSIPALLFLCLGTLAQALPIPPEGQALITDHNTGPDSEGVLFIVDLGTGKREIISDFSDPSQGPTGRNPFGIALKDQRTAIIATDGGDNPGLIFSVDLISGNRTVISDFGDPSQGPLGEDPIGLALNSDGNAIVADDDANGGDGGLFLVDLTQGPSFGQRTLISDFSNPVQGPLGQSPKGVALDGSGKALVADGDGGPGNGALFSVELETGFRTVISNFSDPTQGQTGSNPYGVALDSSGNALVTDEDGGGGLNGILFLVDLTPGPSLGDRTVISNFQNPSQGPIGGETEGVALYIDGNALVTDVTSGTDNAGNLFLVNLTAGPGLGDRTVLSDFGDPLQGPIGTDPGFIALRAPVISAIPTLSEWGLIATAAALGLAGLYAVRRRRATS